MTRPPAKSTAELLRERMTARARANPPPMPGPTGEIDADARLSGNVRVRERLAELQPETIDAHPSPAQAVSEPDPEPEPEPERKRALVRGPRLPPLPFNPIPPNEYCGARTRAGTPCKSRALYRSGRCKNHGGLSTGPKTPEGKARVAQNGKAPKKRARSKAHERLSKVDIRGPGSPGVDH